MPCVLNRTVAAKLGYELAAPSDRPVTPSIGAPFGVASNCTVNTPDCCENARFCHAVVDVLQFVPVDEDEELSELEELVAELVEEIELTLLLELKEELEELGLLEGLLILDELELFGVDEELLSAL